MLFEYRTYLDHLQTTFTKKYGKESDILRIFREGTHRAYDTCPEYTFVYQLRNNMQHFDSIVHSFEAPKKMNYLQPCSIPEILLRDGGWKEPERAFIESAKGNIDLQKVFEATYNSMEYIQVPVMQYFLDLNDGAGEITMLRNWIDGIFPRKESRYYHLAEVDDHGNVTALPVYWEAIYQITDAMRARGEEDA